MIWLMIIPVCVIVIVLVGIGIFGLSKDDLGPR